MSEEILLFLKKLSLFLISGSVVLFDYSGIDFKLTNFLISIFNFKNIELVRELLSITLTFVEIIIGLLMILKLYGSVSKIFKGIIEEIKSIFKK